MNYQNFNFNEEIDAGMDRIVVPSVADVEATSRSLQRKTVGTMRLALAGVSAFLGYADKSNHDAIAADPFAVAVAATASSDTQGASVPKPLTEEEIKLKTDEKRVAYRAQFKGDLSKIENAVGQSKYMIARIFVVTLQREADKAKDDFSKVAINELLLDVSTTAGRYDLSLQANAILTPDKELFTPAFFETEKKILEDAKKHPINAKVLATLADISKESKERESILGALKVLAEDPKDANCNQQVGTYIFYERGAEKGFEGVSVAGLDYLKEGTSPLDRVIAAKASNAIELWGASLNEPNLLKRKRIQMRSVAVYRADPSKFDEKQRAIFEDLIAKNPTLVPKESPRVTISLAAAPEIKPVEIAAKSADVNKGTWVNALQYVDKKTLDASGGSFAPNGQGGFAFYGRDKGSSGITFPFKANGEYEVVVEFTEGDGAKNLGLTFPVGLKHCTLLKGPDYVGFDLIDGKRAAANGTTQPFKADNKKVTVKLSVSKKPGTKSDVILLANIKRGDGADTKEVRYEGPIEALSTHEGWDAEDNKFVFANRQTNANLLTFMIMAKSGSFTLDDMPVK